MIKFNCPKCNCQTETYIEYDFVEDGKNKTRDFKYQEACQRYQDISARTYEINELFKTLNIKERDRHRFGLRILVQHFDPYINIKYEGGEFSADVKFEELKSVAVKTIQCQLCGHREPYQESK
jgi:predicted nucleic-acid-binding Zn-ribbon protein